MAGTTGLEPAASAVTGQRSNQLNYVPTRQINESEATSVYAALQKLRCGRNKCTLSGVTAGVRVRHLKLISSFDYPNSFREIVKDLAAIPRCRNSASQLS